MQLKSIALQNFRQYIDVRLDFATGKDGKNVTLIIGEGGSGKTTFAQAFCWCLYGVHDFDDKVLLNKKVSEQMTPNEKKEVRVALELIHGDVTYKVIRKQNYLKETSNKLKEDFTEINVGIKNPDTGETEWKKSAIQSEQEIQKILPKELYRYFFFDGERISNMSKEITEHRKSDEFAKAVKGLLGLNAMISALDHLSPKRSGVIGSYEASYNSKSDSKMEEYTNEINSCNTKLEKIEHDLQSLDNQIRIADETIKQKSEELKAYEESAKYQKQKELLQNDITTLNQMKNSHFKSLTENFYDNVTSLLSLSLINRAYDVLEEADFKGKDIPYMHAATIDHLLQQKVCICGTPLSEGSEACNNLKEWLKFLPPQSISGSVADFKRIAKRNIDGSYKLLSRMNEIKGQISVLDDDITEKKDEINAINKKFSDSNASERVKAINAELISAEKIKRSCTEQRDPLIQERGSLETQRCRAETSRQKLALTDNANRKIEIYKAYAKKIYEDLMKNYQEKEISTRTELEKEINKIFEQIFDGDFILNIDETYHVDVSVNNFTGSVETSSSQSISVIFAFICGIIKMARDNMNSGEFGISSEPYPLVMDAPLSDFDKKRIKTVCETLPNIAEQLIFFINDKDGEIAEEYMGNKIGIKNYLEPKDKLETIIS